MLFRKGTGTTLLGFIINDMNRIILTVLTFIFSISILFGQNDSVSLKMDIDMNKVWLTDLKSQTTQNQWKNISQRFLELDEIENPEKDSKAVHPVLIVDGIPIYTRELSIASRTALKSLLITENIETIVVIDKAPDGLYDNKTFTGKIRVRLTKKTSSKFQNLKLE